MISCIVPAHNEQARIGRTLQAIHGAAHAVRRPYEVIVVDDASADAISEIARQNKARVVSVHHRRIAATRNAGARAAQGERLFFVDADTIISSGVIAILNCHGELVAWPCEYLLFRYSLRQKRWLERIRLVALMAVCLASAWGAMPVVIWFWTSFFQRLRHFAIG